MTHPTGGEARRTPLGEAGRSHVAARGLDALVDRVRAARAPLVDGWEATALIESLGYTDARVTREFGLSDTRVAGDYVYTRMRGQKAPHEPWTPPNTEATWTIVLRSAASTLIYAVPWLAVFVVQIVRPSVMQLPNSVAPALALALMFSLVASGGVVQAIVRRGEFYIGLGQVGMARQVVGALLRIGIAMVALTALLAMLAGWYFNLFRWSALVLGADAFVVMSVLWMVCGIFAIRQQQWRVAVAFAAGFAAFAGVRSAGGDVMTAQSTAVVVVLVAGALQIHQVLTVKGGAAKVPHGVLMPRLSVLVYWTVPYFWYGTVYFAFLFADRLSAGTAGVAGDPFGVPAQYNLGMELALLTLLVAASGVEVAGALFARALTKEAVRPLAEGAERLAQALRTHHRRALALTVGGFVVTGAAIGELARRNLSGEMTPQAWLTLLAGDVGYVFLAVALVNGLVLFETRRPWTVVRTFTAALAINLISGYVLSHLFGGFYAVEGLVLGAFCFAITSTIAVRRVLQHPDYAYATA